ncbi:MAG: hypothetical protein ACYTKD_18720 [Planctomycetota bacterium]|jgi:hypothetical protein
MNALDLVNKTGWDTRDLRRFVLAGLKAEVGHWHSYTVCVENLASHARYTGWGSLNANWMCLKIEPADQSDIVFPERYGLKPGKRGSRRIITMSRLILPEKILLRTARTLAHEVQHNKGERHRDMTRSSELPVEWAHKLIADGVSIRRTPQPTPKPKRDLQAERRAHAEKWPEAKTNPSQEVAGKGPVLRTGQAHERKNIMSSNAKLWLVAGLLWGLSAVLVVLKLTGHVAWPWLAVLAPAAIPEVAFVVYCAAAGFNIVLR